jgi:hydrogenase maturation protease
MTPVVVIGIGNVLLKDEGVGVHFVEEFSKRELPADVEVVDGGTSGADLINFIADKEKVIVVDAIHSNVRPGTVLRFSGEDLLAENYSPISLHQFGLVDTLLMAKHLKCSPKQVIVYGIKPLDITPGLEMTPVVASVLTKVGDMIMREILKS